MKNVLFLLVAVVAGLVVQAAATGQVVYQDQDNFDEAGLLENSTGVGGGLIEFARQESIIDDGTGSLVPFRDSHNDRGGNAEFLLEHFPLRSCCLPSAGSNPPSNSPKILS